LSITATPCSVKIIKFGLCIEFFLKNQDPLFFKNVPDFTVWIQKISEFSGTNRTDLDAGRITTLPDSLDTKCAFLNPSFLSGAITKIMGMGIDISWILVNFSPVEMPGTIGTSSHTASAANTPIVIHNYNAIRFSPCRLDGTAFHAGGILTLLALYWQVKMTFMRDFFALVIKVCVSKINAFFFFHLQNLNPVDLWFTGLVVLFRRIA